MVRGTRGLLAAAVVLASCAAALAFVSASRAGSSGGTFNIFVEPTQLSAGAQGFAEAKFTADPNSGAATHVVITLDLPSALGSPSSSTCSGPVYNATTGANEFTCDVGTVQAGQTVKEFVTFTAPTASVPTSYRVNGSVTFDVSSTSNSGGLTQGYQASASTTVYSSDPNHQGACPNLAAGATATIGSSASSANPKATSITFGPASSALGFPCTPVDGGVDPNATITGMTSSGVWFVALPQLSGKGLAQVTLTFYSLPSGTNWKKFQLYENPSYPSGSFNSSPVPHCTSTGGLPSGQDSCEYSRSNYGAGGVQIVLLVQGSGIDPGYAG